MFRTIPLIAVLTFGFSLAFAQDSGPGPVSPEVSQLYDVTLYRRTSTLDGTFIFAAGAENGTSSNGDLQATIDAEEFNGTWRAYDFGNYAFWFARAEGSTNSLLTFGWATPDWVFGRASLSAVGATNSFFRALFGRGYLLFGEAAVPLPEGT